MANTIAHNLLKTPSPQGKLKKIMLKTIDGEK